MPLGCEGRRVTVELLGACVLGDPCTGQTRTVVGEIAVVFEEWTE